MPHRSFDAARVGAAREPITFDFGLFGEESFTIVPTPSLGDTLDLYDAPEPVPENELETVRTLVNFIRRLLKPEDVRRFNETLHRIPSDQAYLIIDCAAWIAEQVSGFPTEPATTSSGGRQGTGSSSKKKRGSSPSRN